MAFEALVRATRANPAIERGSLNKALAAIKEAALTEGIHPDALPAEIELRAQAWRDSDQWGRLTLTPTGLAKHWFRVIAPEPEPQSRPTQQQAELDRLRREEG